MRAHRKRQRSQDLAIEWAAGELLEGYAKRAAPLPPDYSNTQELWALLYSRYAYPFEIAGMILLVAIVAAIALTMQPTTSSPASMARTSRPNARALPAAMTPAPVKPGRRGGCSSLAP